MTFSEIKKKEGRISGLVALERALPRGTRAKIKKFIFLILPLVMMSLLFFESQTVISAGTLYGFAFFCVALWLVIFMFDCFYYAHYFEGSHLSTPEWGITRHDQPIPFEILEIVSHTNSTDLTQGFLFSHAGMDIARRLNISLEKINYFLNHGGMAPREKVYADSISFESPLTLQTYTKAVFEADRTLADFFLEHGVSRDDLLSTASWVSSIYARRKEMFRWWGRDSLGRIKGVGKDWSRTETALLERFGKFIRPQKGDVLFKKEIDALEWSLVRQASSGANGGVNESGRKNSADHNVVGKPVLIVADKINKLVAVLAGLVCRIEAGTALPQIAHKEIVILDVNAVDEAATALHALKGPGQFELLMTEIFSEAVEAGHLILVFNNFPAFISAAKKHGADAMSILEPYLFSSDVSVVAFTLDNLFETMLKADLKLMNRFSDIFVESEDKKIMIHALEHRVFSIERVTHLFFTYQSLVAIAEKSSLEFSTNVQENKALKMLAELAPKLLKRGKRLVTARDVTQLL